jgi:transposase
VIGSSGRCRVFAYAAPADMRKSYEGLSALVRRALGRDPLSGDLYLFCNRLRHRAKVLHWDGTGLCIYMKRLEQGRFASLWRDGERRGELELSDSELRLFLEGCKLVGRVALSPARLSEKDLYIHRAL